MKCPNCGKEIANDSNFCEYCGVKVSLDNEGLKPHPKVKWLWLVLGIIGLMILGGYLFLRTYGMIRTILLVIIVAFIIFIIDKLIKSRKS